tara:strand:+ start:253 stop:441 length:189 start_codon:yes stop_codon:yes gene_type:complete
LVKLGRRLNKYQIAQIGRLNKTGMFVWYSEWKEKHQLPATDEQLEKLLLSGELGDMSQGSLQ